MPTGFCKNIHCCTFFTYTLYNFLLFRSFRGISSCLEIFHTGDQYFRCRLVFVKISRGTTSVSTLNFTINYHPNNSRPQPALVFPKRNITARTIRSSSQKFQPAQIQNPPSPNNLQSPFAFIPPRRNFQSNAGATSGAGAIVRFVHETLEFISTVVNYV